MNSLQGSRVICRGHRQSMTSKKFNSIRNWKNEWSVRVLTNLPIESNIANFTVFWLRSHISLIKYWIDKLTDITCKDQRSFLYSHYRLQFLWSFFTVSQMILFPCRLLFCTDKKWNWKICCHFIKTNEPTRMLYHQIESSRFLIEREPYKSPLHECYTEHKRIKM